MIESLRSAVSSRGRFRNLNQTSVFCNLPPVGGHLHKKEVLLKLLDTFAPTSARKNSSFPRGASKEQSSVFLEAQTANVKCFRECFRILICLTPTFIELHKFRGGCLQPCSRNRSIINGCLGEAKTPSSTQNPPRDSLWGGLGVTWTFGPSGLHCKSA